MNVLLLLLLLSNEPKIVKTSIYHAVKSQCNYDPTLTASGVRINTTALKQGKIRYVSISRDLRRYYKYGSYITIRSSNPYYNGKWKVVDTMNKRFKMKIDFLQDARDKNVPPLKVIIK